MLGIRQDLRLVDRATMTNIDTSATSTRGLRPRRLVFVSLFLAVAVAAVLFFALRVGDAETGAPAAFSKDSALAISGLEVESFSTLGEMRAASDGVATGQVANFRISRVIQGDAPEDQVVYGVAVFRVDDGIRGVETGRSYPVEFLLPVVSAAEATSRTDEFAKALGTGNTLLFLRSKAGRGGARDPVLAKAEAGLYRAVNSNGLWSERPDGGVHLPLTRDNVAATYAAELGSVRSFTGVVTIVKALP